VFVAGAPTKGQMIDRRKDQREQWMPSLPSPQGNRAERGSGGAEKKGEGKGGNWPQGKRKPESRRWEEGGGAPSAARRTRAVRGEGGEAGTGLEKTDCCGSGGGGGGDPALFCGT
jgi:hypothetical protein